MCQHSLTHVSVASINPECRTPTLGSLVKPVWKDDLEYGMYAWVVADVKQLPKPVRFKNPSRAVNWVQLP